MATAKKFAATLTHDIEKEFWVVLVVIIALVAAQHLFHGFELVNKVLDYTEHATTVCELGRHIHRSAKV